jgi:hypothetical protein
MEDTAFFACGGRGAINFAKSVFELMLHDSHGGDTVISLNFVGNRVVKVPGYSSAELDNKIHELFPGHGRQPQSEDAQQLVDDVIELLIYLLIKSYSRGGWVP